MPQLRVEAGIVAELRKAKAAIVELERTVSELRGRAWRCPCCKEAKLCASCHRADRKEPRTFLSGKTLTRVYRGESV